MLDWDFRILGMHGRTMQKNLTVHCLDGTSIDLRKHDRLEVGGAINDIHADIGRKEEHEFIFWRTHADNWVNYPSSLLDIKGVSIEHVGVDVMHAIDLGVCPRLMGTAVHRMLNSKAFGTDSTKRGVAAGCRIVSKELRQYYLQENKRRAKVGMAPCAKRSRIVPNMVTKKTFHLKLKAAEGKHMLPFIAKRFNLTVAKKLGATGMALRQSILALQQAYDLMETSSRETLRPEDLHDAFMRCGRKAVEAGVVLSPKFHYLFHFRRAVARSGNPKYSSCYGDESFNQHIVRIAQASHVANFGKTILWRLHLLQRLRAISSK